MRADPDNPRPAPRKKDSGEGEETGQNGARDLVRKGKGERKRRISVAATQPHFREHSERIAMQRLFFARREIADDIFETGLMLATGSRSRPGLFLPGYTSRSVRLAPHGESRV